MKDLRDLKDLTIHDVQPIGVGSELRFECFRFKAGELAFQVSSLGFGVWGPDLRVWSLGFRVWDTGTE